ncbi:hypothetical protein [Paracoccus sp. SM22M-07]|uniref:hypothetical protein n=1 Tax=Paracoccus sp. SM22M-07 TaxID=1520813 RepID=UPI001F0AEA99|nr:hypothetical protein [Paracoccus sp. SM22M-07]
MVDDAEPLTDGADGWLDLMAYDEGFHPITRACMGYHLWNLAGLGQHGGRIAAVEAGARLLRRWPWGGAGGCVPVDRCPSGWRVGLTDLRPVA